MRQSGVRSVAIYCSDYRCSHSTTALADGWPDDMRLSDIEIVSFARLAGAAVLMCGPCSVRRQWARTGLDKCFGVTSGLFPREQRGRS